MSSRRLLYVIYHTHPLHSPPLDDAQIYAALGVTDLSNIEILRLKGVCDVGRVEEVSWREEQAHIARWVEEHRHVFRDGARAEIAYFGATCIPLAMDLGARLRTRLYPRVFHQRHGGQDWAWPGRAEGDKAPEVRVTELPQEADPNARGPVVVSVASSYSIADVDLDTMRRGAIATVRIDLDPIPLDHNPYNSQEELERTVTVFERTISALRERLGDNITELRVAIAGPVGLILRIGGSINPTIYKNVTVWNYTARQTPKYICALRLDRTLEQITMKQTILFLAADASGTLNLPKEHSHIKQRLLEGKNRDRLDVKTELALETKNFIAEISRTNPTVVHFAGHGDTSGALQTIEGNAQYGLRPQAVAAALAELNHARTIQLIVLNACHTKALQDAILDAHAVDHVIAMTDVIADPVAIEFATELYRGLSDGLSIERAFNLAKLQCQLVKLHTRPKDELFSLSSLPGANPNTTRLFE